MAQKGATAVRDGVQVIQGTPTAPITCATLFLRLLRVGEGKNSPRIQETHILVGHVICDIVDQKLFPGI